MNPALKAPGSERLKLKCDDLRSFFAFNINLRRCRKVLVAVVRTAAQAAARTSFGGGRGLHSSTLELNLSRSRTHQWFKLGFTVDRTAQVELK
jgi:hypothetical protein